MSHLRLSDERIFLGVNYLFKRVSKQYIEVQYIGIQNMTVCFVYIYDGFYDIKYRFSFSFSFLSVILYSLFFITQVQCMHKKVIENSSK